MNYTNTYYVCCKLCAEVGIATRYKARDFLFSTPAKTDPGADPAYSTMGTEAPSRG